MAFGEPDGPGRNNCRGREQRMRRLVGIGILAAMWVVVIGGPSAVEAGGDEPTGGTTISVSAEIGGRWATPAGIWVNPCDEPLVFVSGSLEGTRGWTRTGADGVTEVAWVTYCFDPDGGLDPLSEWSIFWVASPDPAVLVEPLFERLVEYLDPPEVTWPNRSPEHDWLFVKVPMDFRVNNLEPITVTASVTNILGTGTASVTATPSIVEFVSGEGGGVSCSADDARLPYVARSPGSCAYTYVNSSSIVGGTFDTTVTMQWDITSAPADSSLPATLNTVTAEALAVSEVQAVVTCVGSGC